MPKITFHRSKCIGCAYCEEIAPLRWQMSSEDGKSSLIGALVKRNIHIANIDFEELEENIAVSESCPMKIIKVDL